MPFKIIQVGIKKKEIQDYLANKSNVDDYINELLEKDMRGFVTKEDVVNMIQKALINLKININIEKKPNNEILKETMINESRKLLLSNIQIDPNGFTDPKLREDYLKKISENIKS